ncbi:MAG: DUF5317 domain-containing protein [Chloroflexi bacterium]|nr:DUF5317 domain-containing protein [Chloroflexota bacterium]
MVFYLPVAAGLLFGLLTGGRFASLASALPRYGWLAAAALAAQFAFIFAPPTPPREGIDPLQVVLPVTLLALAWFLLANWRLPGMWLIAAGFVSNTAVIVANGGLMPTNEAALLRAGMERSVELAREHPGIRLPRSKDVMLPVGQTPLWWLGDVLVTLPIPRRKVFSIGDVLTGAGFAVLVARATRGRCATGGAENGHYQIRLAAAQA